MVKALQSNNQLALTGVFDAATAAALGQEIAFLDMIEVVGVIARQRATAKR